MDSWTPPPSSFVILNIDNCSKGHPGPLGVIGILRDEFGCWRAGFSLDLGCTTSIVTELWVLRTGLYLAWEKGF
jgi:hypothetical protein